MPPTSGYAPHLAGLVGSPPPGDDREDGQHAHAHHGQGGSSQQQQQQQQHGHHHLPHATQSQSQQEPEEGDEQGAEPEEDFLSHQMQQLLVKDVQSFWSNTVAPSTRSIAESSLALQKEAGLVQLAADAELQDVMGELERVQGVVHAFQQQISETLSLLQGR